MTDPRSTDEPVDIDALTERLSLQDWRAARSGVYKALRELARCRAREAAIRRALVDYEDHLSAPSKGRIGEPDSYDRGYSEACDDLYEAFKPVAAVLGDETGTDKAALGGYYDSVPDGYHVVEDLDGERLVPNPGTDKAEPPDDLRAVECRLRAILDAVPYFGDWDEWAAIAYDKIPVLPRAVMAHIYGRHDDTPLPYSPCPLCELFRTDSVGVLDQAGDTR